MFLFLLKQDPDPGSGFNILICRIRIRPKMDRFHNPDQDIGTGTVPYGIIRIRIGTYDPRHPYLLEPLLEVGAMPPRANTIALRMAEREVGRPRSHRVCPGRHSAHRQQRIKD